MYVNSSDCKVIYVCDLNDTDWFGRRLKTVNNSNIHVDRKIRIGCLNVDGTGDNNYRYPDDCKNISRHISSNTGYYYTPDKKHGLLFKGRVDQKARVYDKVGSYCLTEYG